MSVFDQHLQYQINVNRRYFSEVSLYCQSQIGDQTFFINGLYGGRCWRIRDHILHDSNSSTILVEVNDKHHAIMLSLKYS